MWSFPVGAHSPNLWSTKGPLGVFYPPMVWIQDASPKGRPGRSVLWLTYPRHLSQNQTLEQKNCSPENYTTWKGSMAQLPLVLVYHIPVSKWLPGYFPDGIHCTWFTCKLTPWILRIRAFQTIITIWFQPLVCWGARSSQQVTWQVQVYHKHGANPEPCEKYDRQNGFIFPK